MKVSIYKDERYPDYSVFEPLNKGREVEMPEELFRRYEAARKEYDEVQKLIETYWRPRRCRVCGWSLAASPKEGCVPGNCSMRPVQ